MSRGLKGFPLSIFRWLTRPRSRPTRRRLAAELGAHVLRDVGLANGRIARSNVDASQTGDVWPRDDHPVLWL